jgi:hypothetical protein
MITRRTALYVAGGTLLLAYLAAANSSPTDAPEPPRDPVASAPQPDAIAAEVRAEAIKLRELLASAPAPDMHARNPFGFAVAPPAREAAPSPASRARTAGVEPAPEVPPDPPLALIGVAEDTANGKTERTAIITVSGSQDGLYVVTTGDAVAGRYRVTAVRPDAVELKDLLTGGFRQLAMR